MRQLATGVIDTGISHGMTIIVEVHQEFAGVLMATKETRSIGAVGVEKEGVVGDLGDNRIPHPEEDSKNYVRMTRMSINYV